MLLCLQERLPAVPLSGMYNKSGGKVRLTFKLEQDQLWIGTKGTDCSHLFLAHCLSYPAGRGLGCNSAPHSEILLHCALCAPGFQLCFLMLAFYLDPLPSFFLV